MGQRGRKQRGRPRDLVHDKLVAGVRVMRLLGLAVDPELVILGAGLEEHGQPGWLLAQVQDIDEQLRARGFGAAA